MRFHLRTLKFGRGAWILRGISLHPTPSCGQGLPSTKIKWDPALAFLAGGRDLLCDWSKGLHLVSSRLLGNGIIGAAG